MNFMVVLNTIKPNSETELQHEVPTTIFLENCDFLR